MELAVPVAPILSSANLRALRVSAVRFL